MTTMLFSLHNSKEEEEKKGKEKQQQPQQRRLQSEIEKHSSTNMTPVLVSVQAQRGQ